MQLLNVAGNRPANDRQGKGRRLACPTQQLGMAVSLSFLLLLAGGHRVMAQDAQGSAGAQKSTHGDQAGQGTDGQAERPRLLFLLQRPANAPASHEDPYAQLSSTLRTAIEAANRYDIVLYRPEQPSIKRALLEHTVAVSDLVEPIGPDALRHIARAIGARYTLTLKPAFDKQSFKTEMRYDEDLDGENWRTGLAEQIGFEAVVGKRRYKTSELVALTTDAICARLSVPSHLADAIKAGTTKSIAALKSDQTSKSTSTSNNSTSNNGKDPNKTDPNQPVSNKPETDKSAQVARNSDPAPASVTSPAQNSANQLVTDTSAAPVPGLKGVNKTNAGSVKQQLTRVADGATNNATDQGSGSTTAASGGAGTSAPTRSTTKKAQRQQPVPTSAPPIAAPAPTRPDYFTLAMGARKDGDTSTEITMLRKAVTAAPRDAGLRRQLIQAYQDRHMTEMAQAEAERALALMPGDGTLKRLYGDALLSRGNTAGALKVYREVVAHDPADVAAQVALADALLTDNQYAEAMTAYQTAAKADPNSPLPHRRLARVYAGRAAADPTQYQESLKELTLARQLTSNGDTDIYLHDYVALMRQMEQRMRDMADELQNNYQAAVQGTRKLTEVTRAVSDLKERASALADYLDHVPFAVGHEGTHAHYAEGAAMLVQAIGSFRQVLTNGSGRVEDAQGLLRVARVDTLHELATANKLLMGMAEPRRMMSNTSAGETHRPDAVQ